MRHVVIGQKSVLLGDAVTELLVRYAALLVRRHSADSVDMHAYDSSGTRTVLTLLLGEGMTFAAEAVPSDLGEPDNVKTEQLLQSRIEELIRDEVPDPDEVAGSAIWNVDPAD